MATAGELVGSAVRMVTLPDIYIRLKTMLDDPDSSMSDMADLLATDPGLTARLLRMVNSAFFGFGAEITTVTRAVSMLGTQQVHDLVLATSVTGAFSGMSTRVMDMQQFWLNSVRCGVASRLLAHSCNVLDSERLFVSGLLADIGHLIMYQGMPQESRRARVGSQRSQAELVRLERELIGCDYAEVGGELLHTWGLPDSLVEAVRFHIQPAKAEHYPLEAAIVHIASLMAVAIGEEQNLDSLPVNPVVWQVTGLSPEMAAAIEAELEQQVKEAASLNIADERAA